MADPEAHPFLPLAVKCGGSSGTIVLTQRGDFMYKCVPRGGGLFNWLAGLFRPHKNQLVPAEQLLGAKMESPCAFTVWYSLPYTSRTGCVTRHRFKACHTPRFETPDAVAAQALVEHIRRASSWWGRSSPPHIAAIVNPVSGKGAARRLMDSQLLPLLRDVAGLRVTVHVTQARMHAAELVRDLQLNGGGVAGVGSGAGGGGASGAGREDASTATAAAAAVDLIMFVGGDGTLYEGLQGLFQRPDWASVARCPMAAVPCGSGNGLAASAGLWDAVTAVVSVCRGRTEPVDVASVLQPPGSRFYCLLSVVYGTMANLDIGTQHLRWMGELRFHLGALWEIICGRLYNCRVFVLPPPNETGGDAAAVVAATPLNGDAVSSTDVTVAMVPQRGPEGASGSAQRTAAAAATATALSTAGGVGGGGMEERLLSARTSAGESGSGAGAQLGDYPAGPPLPILSSLASLPRPLPDSTASLPAGWRQLPDSFAILGAYNTQYLALGARANPGGRMGDGAWDVWHMAAESEHPHTQAGQQEGGAGSNGSVGGGEGSGGKVRRASGGVRLRCLKVLLGIEDGGFARSPGIMQVTKARALMFEPRDSATWTVLDGEEVPDLPLYLEVHPGLCSMLVSPHFKEEGL